MPLTPARYSIHVASLALASSCVANSYAPDTRSKVLAEQPDSVVVERSIAPCQLSVRPDG